MPSTLGRPFILAAALQIVSIIVFAGVREIMLQTGREYLLETRPVDPRDIFRGDYVVLGYEISSLNYCCYQVGETIYVMLEERDGVARAVGHQHEPPTDARPFIRGQVTRVTSGSGRPIDVEYGIESYFVPEGTGRDIEARIRQGNGAVHVRVAVDRFGTAVIKELVMDEVRTSVQHLQVKWL
jgi:uncharacterized membrane-anchored protein